MSKVKLNNPKFNLYVNLGGYGGYQIVTKNILRAIRTHIPNAMDSVNLFKMQHLQPTDSFVSDWYSNSLKENTEFKDVSLSISAFGDALNFHGKKRILYPAWEGTKIPPDWVAKSKTLDQVWATCTFLRDVYIANGIDPKKVKLVQGGLDTEEFNIIDNFKSRVLNKTIRRKNGLEVSPENPYIFLIVGKYEHRKNSRKMVEAFLKAFEDHPDLNKVKLKMKFSSSVASRSEDAIKADLGPLRTLYPKAFARLELIKVHDVDMPLLYNQSDCLIFASSAEGIGLPLLEAMASGCLTISTSYASLKDYVKEGCGLILPDRGQEDVHDPFYGLNPETMGTWGVVQVDDIKDALLEMYNMDPDKRFEMMIRARSHVEQFDFNNTFLQGLKHINELE